MKTKYQPRTSLGLLGLAASVAILAACLVAGLGAWQILRARDTALQDAKSNIENMTRSLAQHASRSIESVDLVLLGAMEQLEAGADPLSLASYLKSRDNLLEQIRSLVVMNADGAWIEDTAPPHGPLNSADRTYFQWHRDHADRGIHVDQPIVGRTSGKIGIPATI